MQRLDDPHTIRVCNVAGKFLVFDLESVALLRRELRTSGVLAGTTPQQPTQNMFLGLPVELDRIEAEALVRCSAVSVMNIADAHGELLRQQSVDETIRSSYVKTLRRRKRRACLPHPVNSAKPISNNESVRRAHLTAKDTLSNHALEDVNGESLSSPGPMTGKHGPITDSTSDLPFGITLSSSIDLMKPEFEQPRSTVKGKETLLSELFSNRGYYLTPGLRFGAHYSVYPGDPLRFHAHFLWNKYEWNSPILLLDLVGSGRLATAVKKSFLISGLNNENFQTFSIEWAGM